VWERKRILIWGKTRPELSRSHKETVCTGGVFADTRRFVRLYPSPLRFLDDEQVFRKYQWIEADLRKANRDPRPESYNIRCDSIAVGETIPTEKGDWGRRAEWVLQPGHLFRSVEALQGEREKEGTSIAGGRCRRWPRTSRLQGEREKEGTSIGMVKPLSVSDCRVEAYSEQERREFWDKYQSILAQQELQFAPEEERPVRPLPSPEFRFKLQFRCDDPACTKDHLFSVFDWEVDALYNRLRRDGDSAEVACGKVVAKLRDDVRGGGKDTHFFLGNMAAHPHKFTIVGLWYPKKQKSRQMGLFDNLPVG
jgi:hypothetical protein